METLNRPSKQQVRTWLTDRQNLHSPLPDIDQIRRELGWGLLPHLRQTEGLPSRISPENLLRNDSGLV